jgi:FAD/FMN-containing dehydrogenase
MTKLTNFGGNLNFTPAHLYEPRTEEEVLAILNKHASGKIRVVGSLHAWSPAVVCEDAIVSMRHFCDVRIERDSNGDVWATVGGGCRIKELLRKLHALADVTIPSIGLITEQTIAGAIATATHGSGRHSLSHYIVELRVAAYDSETGTARIYTWNDGPELRAARCALGCMGIVLSVRFRCVPNYDVTESIVPCATLEEALSGEDAFQLQQFYLVPHDWAYFAQRRGIVAYQKKRGIAARLYRVWWFLNIDLGLHVIIKLLASILKSPKSIRFFYRHLLAKMILKNRTFVDHSERMLVMEHDLFKHLEIEIFVPERHVRAAAEFVQDIVQMFDGSEISERLTQQLQSGDFVNELITRRGAFTHHYVITFRRVLADDAMISMSSGTETWYAISFITYVEPRDAFYGMASFLARTMARLFDARLHWGKYFPLDRAAVERAYPELPAFREQCRRVDPRGVFRNAFVNGVIFV